MSRWIVMSAQARGWRGSLSIAKTVVLFAITAWRFVQSNLPGPVVVGTLLEIVRPLSYLGVPQFVSWG